MVTVSVSDLKAKLSEHLRRVKAGEQVIVTERGRAVAVLSPAFRERGHHPELEELVDQGLVRPGGGISEGFWTLQPGEDAEGAVRKSLLDERDEGW